MTSASSPAYITSPIAQTSPITITSPITQFTVAEKHIGTLFIDSKGKSLENRFITITGIVLETRSSAMQKVQCAANTPIYIRGVWVFSGLEVAQPYSEYYKISVHEKNSLLITNILASEKKSKVRIFSLHFLEATSKSWKYVDAQSIEVSLEKGESLRLHISLDSIPTDKELASDSKIVAEAILS